MKKVLLFGLALGMAFGAYSQKAVQFTQESMKSHSMRMDITSTNQNVEFQPNAVNLPTGKSVQFDRYELGMSGNVYSVLTSNQRCMAYDEASGAYLGTFRADPATYAGAEGTGTIMAHTSTDGSTWNHMINVNPETAVHALRYPSGVLYNPAGSSNVEDLYAVQAGPSHTAGTWDFTFFGAGQLNDANHTDYYYTWEDANDWARSSMTVVPNAVYNFGQDYEDMDGFGYHQTMKQYVGTTDDAASGFNWEYNAVTPDWKDDPEGGYSMALYTNWSAWSRDGSIGYTWMIGVTNDNYSEGAHHQPVVYYTEDGGDSWDEIEILLEDNASLVEYLPVTEDGGTVRPTFLTGDRTYPGVVDANGNLHLVSNVFGASKADVADPESGYWIVGDCQGGHIFDFVIDANGVQDVIFVDSIMTKETAANAFGDVDWDHRLQVSKSLDEKTIFVVWADDPDSDDQTVKNPDLYTWGYSTEYGTTAGPTNATGDDLYAGFYFYHYVSELTPNQGGFFNIPISTSISPAEFGANDPLAPVTHTFLSGIGYDESDFVGVDDNLVAQEGNISVSQNQPNPFNGTTSIEVSSNTVAPVMVEISNIMGQTIRSFSAGTVNGTKTIEITSDQLEAGIYFYTVRVANESITKKMIVK